MTTPTNPVDHEDDRRQTISRALAVRSHWLEGMLSTPEAWEIIERNLGEYDARRTERAAR